MRNLPDGVDCARTAQLMLSSMNVADTPPSYSICSIMTLFNDARLKKYKINFICAVITLNSPSYFSYFMPLPATNR